MTYILYTCPLPNAHPRYLEKRSQMQVLYSRLQSDGYLFLPRMLPERGSLVCINLHNSNKAFQIEVLEARETIIDFIATTWKDTDMLSVKTDDGTGITLAQQLLFFIHSWYRQEWVCYDVRVLWWGGYYLFIFYVFVCLFEGYREVCVKANCQSPVKLLDKQQLSHHPQVRIAHQWGDTPHMLVVYFYKCFVVQVVSILEHSVLFQFFHDLYSFISTAEQRTEQHLSNSINDNNSMDTNNNNNNNNNQPTNNNHSNKHTIISTTADVITGNLDVPTMRSSDGDDNDNADKEESENSSNSNSEEEDNSESAEGDAVATFEFKWLRAVGYDQHTGVHMGMFYFLSNTSLL